MFTGLIEAVGEILQIAESEGGARLRIAIPFASELQLGDSVAVNGCCLTVCQLHDQSADFDLLAQTLRVTSLGDLEVGSLVNLERALAAGARLGGHFVQGHVDATGTILKIEPVGNDHEFQIQLPAEIEKYCIDKGSLAIDGISLTIAQLNDGVATLWIIPHTIECTHLSSKLAGQRVNLEADLLAKYTEKLLARS